MHQSSETWRRLIQIEIRTLNDGKCSKNLVMVVQKKAKLTQYIDIVYQIMFQLQVHILTETGVIMLWNENYRKLSTNFEIGFKQIVVKSDNFFFSCHALFNRLLISICLKMFLQKGINPYFFHLSATINMNIRVYSIYLWKVLNTDLFPHCTAQLTNGRLSHILQLWQDFYFLYLPLWNSVLLDLKETS